MTENESTAMRLADKIERMAKALEEIKDSPVSRKLLVLYISDKTKMGKQQINNVLDAVESFVEEFTDEGEDIE